MRRFKRQWMAATVCGGLALFGMNQLLAQDDIIPPPPTEVETAIPEYPISPPPSPPQDPGVVWGPLLADGYKWTTYGEFQLKPGDNRVLGDGTLFVPLWQDGTSLIFADVRGQTDDRENYEANWGLGARTLLNSEWIVGGYGFFDRRWTDNSNQFNQMTVGIEALSVQWEARMNGYLPNTGAKTLNEFGFVPGDPGTPARVQNGMVVAATPGQSPRAEFDGTSIVVVTPGRVFKRQEVALFGMDAEFGALLMSWGDNNDVELRGFLGGFWFDSGDNTVPQISGPRTRLELRSYDVGFLGDGSRVTLGAEYQWDQVRDDQFFAMLRVRIPIGQGRRLNPLERRMTDRIVRDVDVLTTENIKLDPGIRELTEPALLTETGQLLSPVNVFDATTGNLPQQIANGQQFVVLNGTAGEIAVNQSIVLRDGQSLWGGGFSVTGSITGSQAVFGQSATVRNSNNTVDTIVLTNNTTLRNVNIIGGDQGVSTNDQDVTNVDVRNTSVTGAADDGYDFAAFSGTIANNTATGNGDDGFDFDGTFNGTLTGNRADNNGENGFDFLDIGPNAVVTNNSATGNMESGFDGLNIAGTFSNNTANNNQFIGFFFDDIETGGRFENNLASGNTFDGFVLFDIASGAIVQNNIAGSNGEDGFFFNDVQTGGVFQNNISTGNGSDGFEFDDVEAGGVFQNNIATNNQINGYMFDTVAGAFQFNAASGNLNGGFFSSDVLVGGMYQGNSATNNLGTGFFMGNIAGVVMDNTSSGNAGQGFIFFDVHDGTGVFQNNTASMNQFFGFNFFNVGFNGIVAGNVADQNFSGGFSLFDVNGRFTSNTATANQGNGFSFFNVNATGIFMDNIATNNLFQGYSSFGAQNGTIANNTGSGNGTGGDTYP